MDPKRTWAKFLEAIGLGPARPQIVTGTILDDQAERARLLRLPPEDQVALLEQGLRAGPEYRAQLGEAAAAWDTWKRPFVMKRMRQALGPTLTGAEMQALIDTYRRLPPA
jgi:hypothetical protein